MAKKESEDVGLDNLKGFFRVGASTRSPGNIPTGHFELDFVLHHGVSPKSVDLTTLEGYDPSKSLGLPLGKLVEVFGEEGAGKSSLAYRVVGYAQRLGYSAVWIDAEQSFSDDLAIVNGVNRDELIFSDMINDDDPDVVYTAESIFDGIIAIIKQHGIVPGTPLKKGQKALGVVVLDSVANLIGKDRMEKNADQATVGVVARLMSENLKKVVNYAAKYGVLLIFINQLREKIGVMFGNPETTPGGRALKFNASVRLRIGKKSGKEANIYGKAEQGKEPPLLGRRAYVRIEKNRFAKPYVGDTIEIPIYYEAVSLNLDDMIFDTGRQLKIIKPYKAEFRWKDGGVEIEGKTEFMAAVKMRGLEKQLLEQIVTEAKAQNVLLTPEITQCIDEKLNNPDADNKGAETKADDNEVELESLAKSKDESADGNADGNEVEKSARRKRKSTASSESE